MIRITDHLAIGEDEIDESFIRSSGPGGQNVNKLATAVQLRFDVRGSPSLTDEVRARLERLAGRRLTRDGVLIITAQRHRTQERNRDDALARLVELIRAATVRPEPRRRFPVGPSRSRTDLPARPPLTRRAAPTASSARSRAPPRSCRPECRRT